MFIFGRGKSMWFSSGLNLENVDRLPEIVRNSTRRLYKELIKSNVGLHVCIVVGAWAFSV